MRRKRVSDRAKQIVHQKFGTETIRARIYSGWSLERIFTTPVRKTKRS